MSKDKNVNHSDLIKQTHEMVARVIISVLTLRKLIKDNIELSEAIIKSIDIKIN